MSSASNLYRRPIVVAVVAVLTISMAGSALPAENEDDTTTSFGSVRAILERRCLSCHNNHDAKGDFSLQSKSRLQESDYLIPGNADESHLLTVVSAKPGEKPSMPKDGQPLSKQETESLRNWILKGAPWPDGITLTEPVVRDFDWWSLRPILPTDVPAPASSDSRWNQSPIDRFVSARHRELGLQHSLRADRRTLIRRVTYDLTGLPPTPQEVREFVNNEDPSAYEKLVERLLASAAYGERWARHWLDVVKYADTCGYDKDKLRPNAWPYRDYVIRSFNDDKPYRQFVQEQIAGDVLFPGDPDGILGLGFIAAGPWDFIGHVEVPEAKLDGRVARNLDRDEMVSNTLNTFCSVTIQCARCHNHKFDPFTQEHYYSLQSVFAAVDRAERIYDTDPEIERKRRELRMERDRLSAALKTLDEDVLREGGEALQQAKALIAELKPKAQPAAKKPEYGYHSRNSATATAEKWVEVDLGREMTVSRVIIHPCHDEFNNINAGFGFPVRFRVELRKNAESEPTVQNDYTESDFPNPGLAPVEISYDGVSTRFVRVTATKLMKRSSDFNFALAEIEIINDAGDNVAQKASVNALDSIEAPVRWRKSNLTDGIWPQAADSVAVQQLAGAQRKHAEILKLIMTPARRAKKQSLQEQRTETDKQIAELPKGRVVYAAATHFSAQGNFKPTKGTPRAVKILHRGNIQQPGKQVSPGVIPLHSADDWHLQLPENHSEADRRAALAQWITSPDNPLTWRSIVNRIWQYHFGMGIVESANDLGRMGQTPTHPRLLDWLADEFRRTQSFKHMHRLIVNSETYKQVSAHQESCAAIDGGNRFLWRMNRRRLSAEELRDSILAVSGRLDRKPGGPGFYLFALEKTAHSPHYEYHKFDPNDEKSHRRSVYRFIVRSQPDPYMTTLDCADSSQSTPRRTETLTSLQALSLLNNKFNLAMAQHFADRLTSSETPIVMAFELVTGRVPTAGEFASMQEYAQEHGMANLCRVLFNMSEFVFLD